MIGSPVARQQPHDLFLAFLAARIAKPGQLLRVPFAGHDRSYDRHTRGAAQIGDRLMDSRTFIWSRLFCSLRIQSAGSATSVAWPLTRLRSWLISALGR